MNIESFRHAYGENNEPGSSYANTKQTCVFGDQNNDGSISYIFDKYGFRTKTKPRDADIFCFGCSFTFGLGVEEEKTWPSVLGKLAGDTALNFGVCSGSLETCYRLLKVWLDDGVKADTVCILVPPLSRREVLYSNGAWQNVTGNIEAHVTESFLSPHDQWINQYRTLDAIKHVCKDVDLQIVYSDDVDFVDYARDNIHPGPVTHEKIAGEFFDAME